MARKLYSLDEIISELEPNSFASSTWRVPEEIVTAFIKTKLNHEITESGTNMFSIENEDLEKIIKQWEIDKSLRGLTALQVSFDDMLAMLELNISTHTPDIKNALSTFISSNSFFGTSSTSDNNKDIFIKKGDIKKMQEQWTLYKQQIVLVPFSTEDYFQLEKIVRLLEPEKSQTLRNKHCVKDAVEAFLCNLEREAKVSREYISGDYIIPDVSKLQALWDDHKQQGQVQLSPYENYYSSEEIIRMLEPFAPQMEIPGDLVASANSSFIDSLLKEGLILQIDDIYYHVQHSLMDEISQSWEEHKDEVLRKRAEESYSLVQITDWLEASDSVSLKHAINFTNDFLFNCVGNEEISYDRYNQKYVINDLDRIRSKLISKWQEYKQQPLSFRNIEESTDPVQNSSKIYSRVELIDMLEPNINDVRSRGHAIKLVDAFLTQRPSGDDEKSDEIIVSIDAMSKLHAQWHRVKRKRSRPFAEVQFADSCTYKRTENSHRRRFYKTKKTIYIKKTQPDAEESFLAAIANGYHIKGDYVPTLSVLIKAKKMIHRIKKKNPDATPVLYLPRPPRFGIDIFLATRFQAYSLNIYPAENFKLKPGQAPEDTKAFKVYSDLMAQTYGQHRKIQINKCDQYTKGVQSIQPGEYNDLLPQYAFPYHINPKSKTAYIISRPKHSARKADVKKYTLGQQGASGIEFKLGQWLQKSIQLGTKKQKSRASRGYVR